MRVRVPPGPLALAVALLLAAAAARRSAGGEDAPAGGPGNAPEEARWARRQPLATVLLAGRHGGRLVPCASRRGSPGGLTRLGAVLDLLRGRTEGSLAAISVGGVAGPAAAGELAARQQGLKAALWRRALVDLGFSAALLAPDDLAVKPLVDALEGPGTSEVDRPRLPANVMPSRLLGADPDSPARPWVDLRLRSLALRALCVVDEAAGEVLASGGLVDYVMAPAGALQGLAPNPDVLWIVAVTGGQATRQTVERALRALGPAVLIDLSGASDGGPRTQVPLSQGPLVVSFEDRGRAVGVLDLDLAPDGRGLRASYVAQPLAPGFDAVGGAGKALAEDLLGIYRAKVREDGLLSLVERRAEPAGGARYVGSAACAACHPGISQSWARTPHARALRSLRQLGQEHDPECLACHALGATRGPDDRLSWWASGYAGPEETPHLGGVGCESCHGPGSRHVEAPRDRAAFAPGGPNRRDPGPAACRACHDADASVGFGESYAALRTAIDHGEVPSDRRTTAPR